MSESRSFHTTNSPSFLSESIINTIKHGDLDRLKILVENEKLSLEGIDPNSFSPVFLAIQHGHLPILIWLVKTKNLSINENIEWLEDNDNNFFNYSPLDLAFHYNHGNIVKWIVKENYFEFYHNEKKSVIKFFIKENDTNFINWLIKNTDWFQMNTINGLYSSIFDYQSYALGVAVKMGKIAIVQWLIDTHRFEFLAGWNKYKNFFNFLHYVLAIGQLEIAKWLVDKKGFSLEPVNQYKSIVFLAVRKGEMELLKWLIDDKGYSLYVKDEDNDNVLTYALYFKQFFIVKWLVEEKKFSLAVTDNKENSPLLLACSYGPLELVKWLVEKQKLPLNVDDGFGRNPVIKAVSYNQINILKYLVNEKGCSLDVKSNTHGTYPIHYAAYEGNLQILQWLVDVKNCSLQVVNNANQNIIDFARFDNNILEWLVLEKNIFQHSYFRNHVKSIYRAQMYANEFRYLYQLLNNSTNNTERREWMEILDEQIMKYPIAKASILKDSYIFAIEKFKQDSSLIYHSLFRHYTHKHVKAMPDVKSYARLFNQHLGENKNKPVRSLSSPCVFNRRNK